MMGQQARSTTRVGGGRVMVPGADERRAKHQEGGQRHRSHEPPICLSPRHVY
jgi:hypothetical protein